MVCFPSVMFSCSGSCADLIRYALLNCLSIACHLNFITTVEVIFNLYFPDEVTELRECITFRRSCRWEVSEFRFESRSVTFTPRVINFDMMSLSNWTCIPISTHASHILSELASEMKTWLVDNFYTFSLTEKLILVNRVETAKKD